MPHWLVHFTSTMPTWDSVRTHLPYWLVDLTSLAPMISQAVQIGILVVVLVGFSVYYVHRVRSERETAELEQSAPAPEFGFDYVSRSSKDGGR